MRTLKRKLFFGKFWGASVAAILLAFRAFALHGQSQVQIPQPGQNPTANQGQGRVGVGTEEEADNPIIHRAAVQAQMKRNVQRQQQIVKDTAKLAELVQQLKDEVGKSDKGTPSVSVARKAEEIEKLAKSVKDKMKAE